MEKKYWSSVQFFSFSLWRFAPKVILPSSFYWTVCKELHRIKNLILLPTSKLAHTHTSLRSLRDGFAKKLVGVHFDFHHYHYYQHPRLKDDHQSWLRRAGVLDFWSIAIHPPPIYRTDHLYKPALASLLRCYHRHCHHYQHCNNFWRCRHQHRPYHLRQKGIVVKGQV